MTLPITLMTRYFVLGGTYQNTRFETLQDGHTLERHGPFNSWQDALETWQQLSWQHVDDCLVRYHIADENDTPMSQDSKKDAS
ncbi:MAG: DUF4170 domain-containing protein [Alphaproteobacteria bacterium GM202ARS2]|nr:DUF4170 domain-containing protein [Alphaproteobacteria bacterium GM202ARS2]